VEIHLPETFHFWSLGTNPTSDQNAHNAGHFVSHKLPLAIYFNAFVLAGKKVFTQLLILSSCSLVKASTQGLQRENALGLDSKRDRRKGLTLFHLLSPATCLLISLVALVLLHKALLG
jgi:hypothetical protein